MHGIPPWVFGAALSGMAVAAMLVRIEQRLDAIVHLLAAQAASGTDRRDALIAQIAPLVQSGRYIEAIRIVRQTLGCSLLDAKRFVDDLRAQTS